MKRFKKVLGYRWIILLIMMYFISNILGFISQTIGNSTSGTSNEVTEDSYMETMDFDTNLIVNPDNSYSIRENIQVDLLSDRHGIYRYIPKKGTIFEGMQKGKIESTPYFSKIKLNSSNVKCNVSNKNGNKVFRLGDKDKTVSGLQDYEISYKVTPMTSNGYQNAYYNVFPQGWQNAIPAGSSFTITFPKKFDHNILRFYYGTYGQQRDGADILNLSWNGNQLKGTLKKDLALGEGVTFYAPMKEGYFTGTATTSGYTFLMVAVAAVTGLILLLLFLRFGRDEKIIPSIQYAPPEGLDSAAVGYIIDGTVDDKDLISLLVSWADQGYLMIKEEKGGSISLVKKKSMDEAQPAYAKTLFQRIFHGKDSRNGAVVKISSLQYKLADTFNTASDEVEDRYQKDIYTSSSVVCRWVALVVEVIPLGVMLVMLLNMTNLSGLSVLSYLLYIVGTVILSFSVDKWYARSNRKRESWAVFGAVLTSFGLLGIFAIYTAALSTGRMLPFTTAVVLVLMISGCFPLLTAFMKKRTHQCVQWMGYLAGLRDFIQTAELERMEVIAKDTPELFYHILPFAYVFGLSDVFIRKLSDLKLPAPDWYEPQTNITFFDYYVMSRLFSVNLKSAAATLSTPKPTSRGSGGFGGGGGGGFSGGGFGGGGGGSW